MYWLIILFMFPLLGSIVYFAVVFLPDARLQRGVRKAGSAIQATLNPGREMREAQQAFDLTPTAHNQMRLAAALFDAGMVAQAVEQYDACLRGPFGVVRERRELKALDGLDVQRSAGGDELVLNQGADEVDEG